MTRPPMARSGVSAAARYEDRLKKKRRAIHVKRRRLDLDDETYLAILRCAARVESSADLTTQNQADAVLDELRRLGAPSAPGPVRTSEWRFVFSRPESCQRYLKKIYRLAQTIGRWLTPPVNAMSKAWVEGIVMQAGGLNHPDLARRVVTRLELCGPDALYRAVQILAVWCEKNGRDAQSGARRPFKSGP